MDAVSSHTWLALITEITLIYVISSTTIILKVLELWAPTEQSATFVYTIKVRVDTTVVHALPSPLEQRSFFVCYHWTAGLLRSSFLIRFPTICIQFVLFEPRTPWIPTHQCLLVPVPRARLCCRLQPDRCSSFSNCWQSGSCFAVAHPAPDPASPCLLLRTSLLLHWYCSLARDIASVHDDTCTQFRCTAIVSWLITSSYT